MGEKSVIEEPRDDSFAAFLRAYNDIDALYDQLARRSGVSSTEYWALLFVSEGLSSQREVARALSASRQTVNSAFTKLVRRGLLALEPDRFNRRIKRARLTEEGREFVERYVGSMYELERRLWLTFDEHDRRTLSALLACYRDEMRAAIQGLPPTRAPSKNVEK